MENYIINNPKNKILEGMKEVTEIVGKTFGPNGHNVIIDSYALFITTDGFTVCNNISFEDKLKNVGCTLLKNYAQLTKEMCNDGTTSTIILGTEICDKLIKYDKTKNINDIIKEFKRIVLELLEKNSKKNITSEELKQVIYTCCNDKKITSVVFDILKGNILNKEIDYIEYKTTKGDLYYESYDGLYLNTGIASKLLLEEENLLLNEPYCIIINDDMKTKDEIINILKLIKEYKYIYIIANSFSKEVIDYAIYLKKHQNQIIALSYIPADDINKEELLDDISIYLNTPILNKNIYSLNNITIGKAKCIEIDSEKTIIKRKFDKNLNLENRISYLKKKMKANNQYKKRYLNLVKGIKTIYIPLVSEYEYDIIKEKVVNAINTGMQAIKSGISKGMGEAFKEVGNEIVPENEIIDQLKKSLFVLNDMLNDNISKERNDFIPLDATSNLKIIISNVLQMVNMFMSIDGYVRKKVEISDNNFKNFF